jgi:hypothetical protein
MVAEVPAPTTVTRVGSSGLLHVPPASVFVNVIELPMHTCVGPEIAEGDALTTIDNDREQSVPGIWYLIVAVPVPGPAVKTPPLVILPGPDITAHVPPLGVVL